MNLPKQILLLLLLQLKLISLCLGIEYIAIKLNNLAPLQLEKAEGGGGNRITIFVQFLVGKQHEKALKEPQKMDFSFEQNSAWRGIFYSGDQGIEKRLSNVLNGIVEFNKDEHQNKNENSYPHEILFLEFTVKKGEKELHRKCVSLAGKDGGPSTKTAMQISRPYKFDIRVHSEDLHPCPLPVSEDVKTHKYDVASGKAGAAATSEGPHGHLRHHRGQGVFSAGAGESHSGSGGHNARRALRSPRS